MVTPQDDSRKSFFDPTEYARDLLQEAKEADGQTLADVLACPACLAAGTNGTLDVCLSIDADRIDVSVTCFQNHQHGREIQAAAVAAWELEHGPPSDPDAPRPVLFGDPEFRNLAPGEQIRIRFEEVEEAREADLKQNLLWETDPDPRKLAEYEKLLKDRQAPQLADCQAPDFDGTVEAVPWLVPSWIPRRSVTLLSGRGGSGKSRLALQLAVQGALGGGRRVFGDEGPPTFTTARHFRTLFLSWEDPAQEYHRRLSGHVNRDTDEGKAAIRIVNEAVRYFALQGQGPLWKPQRTGSKHISTRAERSELWLELEGLADDFRPGLVVIDTVAAAYMSDENARPLVRDFLNELAAWAGRLDAAVLLVSHPSKSSTISGSTDWEAGVRTVLRLERPEAGGLDLKHHKANYAPLQDPVCLSADHYPYHAIKPLPPELEDLTPARQCAGWGDYVCDREPEGRKKRCQTCQDNFDLWRRGRSPR